MLSKILLALYEIGKDCCSYIEQPICILWNSLKIVASVFMDPTFIGCIFTLALLKISFFVSSWVKNRRMEQTLFSRYDIPYVEPNLCSGSLHELRNNNSDENEIQVIDRWIKKYGKVFGYYVGSKPHLMVADVDMIKEILSRKSANYLNRPKLAIQAYPVMDTLVGLRDSRWKEVRHMLSPAFTPAKLKPMMKNMNEKVDILISLIEKKCTTDGQLEWVSTYQGLTLDIISSCAFAMETNCIMEQDNDPLLAAVRDFLMKAMNAAVLWAQYFPIIAWLMTVINNYWMKSGKATIMIVESLEKAISARRKDSSAKRKDILQMILDASDDSNGDLTKDKMNKVKPLSDKEIIANSWVFLLGGYETTASALAFTTYLLAKHPDVQEKLYEEISENMSPENDRPTYEDIMKLSYLDQVFNESLRMYPPVSSFLQRETTNADEINGLTIPKETNIVIPIWQIHHDPIHWPEPFKFYPERFSVEAKADPNRNLLSFIPFGYGPRNCIGMRFGQVVSKLTFARLLLKYRFEVCENTPEDLNLTIPTVTLLPKEKIILRIVKRD